MDTTNDLEPVLDSAAVESAIERLAEAIMREFCGDSPQAFALLGLHQRGVPLAERIAAKIITPWGFAPPCGMLDISMYRDDIGRRKTLPPIRNTEIPFDVDNNNIVLVDDVFSSGRTVRAALDAITDYGRPRTIRLAVLVDRHASEYPIRPDFSGTDDDSGKEFKLIARVKPIDDEDAVYRRKWINS